MASFWFLDIAERTGPVAFQITCRNCGYQWQKWEEPPNAEQR